MGDSRSGSGAEARRDFAAASGSAGRWARLDVFTDP
jgi:hypothetical protein